jgi:hypothetical protein
MGIDHWSSDKIKSPRHKIFVWQVLKTHLFR